jgi:hypothetical protein
MFAFSIGKLLVLGLVIYAVWSLWRRIDAPKPRQQRPPAPGEAVDLIRCRVCGVFVSGQAAHKCGRGDCPAN